METITGKTSQAIQDETLLIRRILDGHTELFRQLAGRYAGQVLRMVASLIPSQEEAEEVTQDALLEAFQSLARFDARQASFQTWLMRIAYHTALKHYRQHHKTICSRWDRYLGMTAAMTQVPVPTAIAAKIIKSTQ